MHSLRPDKNRELFLVSLVEHRKRHGDVFIQMVFPESFRFGNETFHGVGDFRQATFLGQADFHGARFTQKTDFGEVRFKKGADFHGATFTQEANFQKSVFEETADFCEAKFGDVMRAGRATFRGGASFVNASFAGDAHFWDATFGGTVVSINTSFEKMANFHDAAFEEVGFIAARFGGEVNFKTVAFNKRASFTKATFEDVADFSLSTFSRGAGFKEAAFKGKRVSFHLCAIHGGTLFTARKENGTTFPVFAGNTEVDFREVILEPLDALAFRDADLRKCRFLGTDLRKVELTGVTWPEFANRSRRCENLVRWLVSCMRTTNTKTSSRLATHDWIVCVEQGEAPQWEHLERLYRELKQNYEERRAYEKAGNFHYLEKEMRRQNPDTPLPLYVLLRLYWWFSGYGERATRPLLYALILLLVSALSYFFLGVSQKDGGAQATLGQLILYSFRVMTLLKSDDFVLSEGAKWVNTFQSLLGPLFFGLFALAVRQKLKR
ncbi:MAG: pentapeptide repeat-containing protein [Verrucomicrobia bacterium]|nr:pentapeptide repeat-containing protein [Verrucomicrobiota bacterium]